MKTRLAQLNLPPLALPGLGPLVTGDSIDRLVTSGIPEKSKQTTQWAMNVWRERAVFRLSLSMHGEEATHELRDDFLSMCAADQSLVIVSISLLHQV